jgi:MYXO-CTERM domain-containing protein
VWFVATCQHGLDVDHRHPDAGNFVLSRGKDDLIVDPSPYGSQSTLTSNAPTVASSRLPAKYAPSQGAWSTKTGWDFTTQTRSGVVAARCDYADQFRFQERASDIADAVRDLVVVPSSDGGDAAVVVVDRAQTGAGNRAMYLRFRVPGELALDGDLATRTIGMTRLAIASVARSSGRPVLGHAAHTDCYADEATKGRCDAARFSVSDLRIDVDGPAPSAVHVISATAADGPGAPRSTQLTGDGWAGVRIAGPRDAVVVWPTGKRAALTYRAPRALAMTHVVLVARDHLALTARADGDACVVSAAPGSASAARPLVAVLDDACRIEIDPPTVSAAAALGPLPPAPPRPPPARHRRWGCSTGGSPDAPLALVLAVIGWACRRRRPSRAAP